MRVYCFCINLLHLFLPPHLIPPLPQVGPQFLCPEKLQLREGVKLTCEVSGNPIPSVTWRRDGQVVVPPTHLNRGHAGEYTVSAEGARGRFDLTLEVEVLTAKGMHLTYSENQNEPH